MIDLTIKIDDFSINISDLAIKTSEPECIPCISAAEKMTRHDRDEKACFLVEIYRNIHKLNLYKAQGARWWPSVFSALLRCDALVSTRAHWRTVTVIPQDPPTDPPTDPPQRKWGGSNFSDKAQTV